MCRGRGEVSQVTRSFLGQVMTSRPCPQCQGFGTVVPTPCPECAGDGRVRSRRTLTVKIPAGVDVMLELAEGSALLRRAADHLEQNPDPTLHLGDSAEHAAALLRESADALLDDGVIDARGRDE